MKPNYNKGGRPKKLIKRSKQFNLNMTQLEYAVLKARSQECHMSLNAFLISMARHGIIHLYKKEFPQSTKQLLQEVHGATSNLNQLVKWINTQGWTVETIKIKRQIDELLGLFLELKEELRNGR